MLTVGNLLVMDRCASCERELASTWKFCLYCGRPLVLVSGVKAKLGTNPSPRLETDIESAVKPTSMRELDPELGIDAIPAAIRVEQDEHVEQERRKYDGAFWVGVGMGLLGLVLIIYAAVQILGSAS